jgi:outer membrane protein OmpA-like peptidoglycan-associated protein
VVPFVGLGVGYQAEILQGGVAAGPQFSNLILYIPNNTVGSFAYQAMLGLAFPIAGVPGLAITTEYRFMGLAGDRSLPYVKANGGTGPGTGTVKLDDYNHAILIGLRYNFGAPTAPPPNPGPIVTPVPTPARSYLVFFDWDKATLTPRAQQIIGEAAANSTKVQYTQIQVNGYTDTSGTPQYNQGLSIRRAQAVAAELVKDGVPKAAIAIQGFGETHLLVPTGPGVREPQNRRVEIIIR